MLVVSCAVGANLRVPTLTGVVLFKGVAFETNVYVYDVLTVNLVGGYF